MPIKKPNPEDGIQQKEKYILAKVLLPSEYHSSLGLERLRVGWCQILYIPTLYLAFACAS